MELIFDAPLDPSALNDDCLRRFLDQFAKACPEDFFNQLALKCYAVFDLPRSTLLHGDTTSHEVCGEYEEEEGIPHLGPMICAGYNKTGRKDRKIFNQVSLATAMASLDIVPLWMGITLIASGIWMH